MAELAIGEELRIRCVEDTGRTKCEGCFFLTYESCDDLQECRGKYRKDGKNVHYELVKED